MEIRSSSSASQSTLLMKKSRLPSTCEKYVFEANSAFPTTTSRPFGLGGDEGVVGVGVAAGLIPWVGSVLFTATASVNGPCTSSPGSILAGAPKLVSPQERSVVLSSGATAKSLPAPGLTATDREPGISRSGRLL